MITIIDYGMGNINSICNMLKRIGVESQVTGDLDEISKAEKLILPGVGAFDTAMTNIRKGGYEEVLTGRVLRDKVPVLGICLGMQLLTNSSEEGTLPGLGWIPGETIRFSFKAESHLKVPHMGWNEINIKREDKLVASLPEDTRFYFVHSYHVKTRDRQHAVATTIHGIEFDSIISRENIFGAQFHPEKSHKFGMKLLENFAHL